MDLKSITDKELEPIKHGIISSEHQQLTQSQQYKAGWSCYLVLAGVVTTLGLSLPVGYNIGVVNTPAEVIKKFCNESVTTRYEAALSEAWLNVLWAYFKN